MPLIRVTFRAATKVSGAVLTAKVIGTNHKLIQAYPQDLEGLPAFTQPALALRRKLKLKGSLTGDFLSNTVAVFVVDESPISEA